MSTSEVVEITSDNDSNLGRKRPATTSTTISTDIKDKPIVQFLKRLIEGKSQKKTLLTNAQIFDILKNELNIDIKNLHNLEEITYLHVMKKCLQDWPEWSKFGQHVFTFEKLSDTEKKAVLKSSYKSLKLYLYRIYKTTVPLTKAAVQELQKKSEPSVVKDATPNPDVVLNICATNTQLQKLIFRQPNPQLGDTIFNVCPVTPPKIKIVSLSMQSILNWCGVNLYFLSPVAQQYSIYKRENKHEYKHVLVNKKLKVKATPPEELSQALQVKDNKGKTVKRVHFIQLVQEMSKVYSTVIDNAKEIFDFLTIEMLMLPTEVLPMKSYRRYTNKYPYIRYLYEDVENVGAHLTEMYDLQLEETIMPSYEFYLGNIDNNLSNEHIDPAFIADSIVIECTNCNASFRGKDIVKEVTVHFELNHTNETDFKCTSCGKEFTVEALTHNWWCHDC